MVLNNKSILSIDGTRSLGKALKDHIFRNHPDIKRLVIYSRNKQKEL
jgi:hypothetical protein